MVSSKRATLLPLALSFLIGAQQATGQFPNIGDVGKALSNPPDPKKIEEAVKGADPKDVVQAVGSGVAEGQKKVSEASEQATAVMQAGAAAVATPLPETTTLLPTSAPAADNHAVTTVEGEHHHLAQAVEDTNIAKIGEGILNGGIADVLKGNVDKVTEAIGKANPGEVTSKLGEDTKNIASQLSEAKPSEVLQEVSKPDSSQAGTSPGEVVDALKNHATQKVDELLNGQNAADVAKQIGNTSPKDVANALPDTTPNEAIDAARQSVTGGGSQDGILPGEQRTKYIHPGKGGEPGEEEGSGVPVSVMVLLGLGGCVGAGWYTFHRLTRPKRTGLPMLDAELGEGDSVHMMHSASGPWGGGGRARDFSGPAAGPGFQRF